MKRPHQCIRERVTGLISASSPRSVVAQGRLQVAVPELHLDVTERSADFLGLAAGKTGERGLWDEMAWYCSVECAPEQLRDNEPNQITPGQE